MKFERVLIVGLGSIGVRHLRLARSLLPDADIRVMRRQIPDTLPEHSDGCLDSLEQAKAFAPQIAVIANPAPFHVDVAQGLVESGAHLLVEKPLADTSVAVAPLLDCCRQHERVLLTGYNLRYLPSLQRFRQLVHERLVGRVMSVRSEIGQYLPLWRPGSDYRLGVSANRALGGGALLELSHELDYMRWIFGEVDWVQASLERQSLLEIDVEDTAHLLLGFMPNQDGRRLVANVSLDFVRHDLTRTCIAIGEFGSLRWNGIAGTVEHFKAGTDGWQEIFRHQQQRDESYLAEWQHLMACIEAREIPLVSGEDGLKVLHIVEAARIASDEGRRVHVAHPANFTQTGL